MKRRVFQWFTALLLLVCVWTAYANVLSDDTPVRALARVAVNRAAGCGDDCKLENLRGDRGMLETVTHYDILKHGHYVVVCKRAFVVVGAHTCVVTEGKVAPTAASAGASSDASHSAARTEAVARLSL